MSDKTFRRKVKTFVLSSNFWWALIAIGGIARLATWLFPFDSDHWIFYYVGRHWFDGGTLYLTVWDHKTPMIFLINGLMSFIFGDNLVFHRIFFTILSAISIWLFYLTTKRLLRYLSVRNVESSVRISTLAFAFWTNLSQFTNSANTTESFGLLFLLASLFSYLRYKENKHWKWLLYSGASISLLVSLKINFAILLLPMIVDFVVYEGKSVKSFLSKGLVWTLPTIFQAYFWYSYFNARRMVKDAVIAGFSFNSKYLRAGWAGNLSEQTIFVLMLGIALLFFMGFLFFALKDTRIKNNRLFIITLAVSAILFSAILGTFYNHYYLIVMPYLSFLVAVYWREVLRSKALILFCAVGLIGSYAISVKQLYNNFYGNVSKEAAEMRGAAEYIKERTSVNDKIIYQGYGATFYQLAHRDSGSRFISASHPLIDERENFGFNFTSKHIGDMAMSVPKYIIINTATKDLYSKNTRVQQYFKNHYAIEKSLPGYEILVRIN